MKFVIFFVLLQFIFSQESEDELAINFLPSDKYKLNKRDLRNLKSDIERQLMQRVLELQANWDERQKLRRFSISRPPVISPPYPIQAPAYSPNLLTTISQPPLEYGRRLGDDEANNAGSNGYSFKMKKDELSEKLHNIKESLEEEIKETKDLLMQKEAKEEKAKLIETALQMMKKDKPDLDENKVKKILINKTNDQLKKLIKTLNEKPEVIMPNKVTIKKTKIN